MSYYRGDIKFKNVSSDTVGLIVTAPPLVTHSEVRHDSYTIPGRDGDLYSMDTYRGNATIKVSFALVKTSAVDAYQKALRQIRLWLQGTGKLVIADSTDSYYEVQKVTIDTDNRVILQYGTLEVTFTVYPYEFLNTGDTGVTSFPITNDADVCYPLYKIAGTGSGTLTVNSKTMSYTVSGTLYIDTRRMIAYDGSDNNCNDKINGDYTNLYLKTGSNSVSATVGTLTVYPKWGYKV